MTALEARRSWRASTGQTFQVSQAVVSGATGLTAALAGAGVLIVGLAYAHARSGGHLALLLFWPGILLIVAPATMLLIRDARKRDAEVSPKAVAVVSGGIPVAKARSRRIGSRATIAAPVRRLRRRPADEADPIPGRIDRRHEDPRRVPGTEAVALVLIVGLALYLVKVMTSPLQLTGPDEFTHWRTLEDILRTTGLFADNPLLRMSPIYPGLEAAAAVVVTTTGLDVFPVAILLIGTAKIATVLGVFLIAATVTGSNRVAGVAALIYMANPSFLLFDAMFSYELLAIPLALIAIWAVLRWVHHRGRVGLHAGLALAAIAGTAVTHHLTSFALLAFLATWAAVWFVRDRGRSVGWPIVVAAGWALGCDVAWLLIAGTAAVSYLTFIIQGGVRELLLVIAGVSEARQLFAPRPGLAAPLPEVLAAYGAVLLLLLASLPPMLLHAVRVRRPPAVVVALGLAALLYPASLAMRFTTLGAEVSQRASEFLLPPAGNPRRRLARRGPRDEVAAAPIAAGPCPARGLRRWDRRGRAPAFTTPGPVPGRGRAALDRAAGHRDGGLGSS